MPNRRAGKPMPLAQMCGKPSKSELTERKVMTHVRGWAYSGRSVLLICLSPSSSCVVSRSEPLPSVSPDNPPFVPRLVDGIGELVLLNGSCTAPHNDTHANVDFFEIEKHDPISYQSCTATFVLGILVSQISLELFGHTGNLMPKSSSSWSSDLWSILENRINFPRACFKLLGKKACSHQWRLKFSSE